MTLDKGTMSENYLGQDFTDYCDKWEKALSDGVFNDAPKPASPTPQTADPSYFGPVNTNPTAGPEEADWRYWDAIYQASDHSGMAPDPLEAASDQLMTDSHNRRLAGLPELNEASKKKHRDFPPNPVSVDTGGKDQDLTPEALGQTFDEKDIKSLEEMKIKLYELESKVAGALGKGNSDRSFQSQIDGLKKRIDDLSTQMGNSYPTDIA